MSAKKWKELKIFKKEYTIEILELFIVSSLISELGNVRLLSIESGQPVLGLPAEYDRRNR